MRPPAYGCRVAWYQDRGASAQNGSAAGRRFYTSSGHLNETWQEVLAYAYWNTVPYISSRGELFLSHVLGGITWALDSGKTKASSPDADLGGPSTTGVDSSPSPMAIS